MLQCILHFFRCRICNTIERYNRKYHTLHSCDDEPRDGSVTSSINEMSVWCQMQKKKKSYRRCVQNVGINVHRKHCGHSTLKDKNTTQVVSIFHCDQNQTGNRFNGHQGFFFFHLHLCIQRLPPWATQVTSCEAWWLDWLTCTLGVTDDFYFVHPLVLFY